MSYENCFGNTLVNGPTVITRSLIKSDIQSFKLGKTKSLSNLQHEISDYNKSVGACGVDICVFRLNKNS